MPFNTLYHGTKFALEGISEALNFELNSLGVQVKIVEPGGVKTDFASRSLDLMHDPDITAYDEAMQRVVSAFTDPARQQDYSTGEDIAKVIYEAATDGTPQLRYAAGKDAVQMLGGRSSLSDEVYLEMMKKEFGI